MKLVGFSSCPADAVKEVKQSADYISKYKGGRGAVRELIEMILKAQGKWDDAQAKLRNGVGIMDGK